MERLYRAHIETLHPEQIRMLEDIISEGGTPTDAVRHDIMRIVHILMRGKGNLIAASTSEGMGIDEIRAMYGNHPGLEEFLASMERTIETTKRITKERDFERAIELLEQERALGFLPNIVTFKRLIIKTGGDLQKLRRIEKYILSEGITKNEHYNFYANLIKNGLYNPRHRGGQRHNGADDTHRPRGHSSQRLEDNPKYQEAIRAGLSHDLARAIAQGLLSTKY